MQEATNMEENAQLAEELPPEQPPPVVKQRRHPMLLRLILLVLCLLFLSGGILGIIYYQWPFLSAINGLTISGVQPQTSVIAPSPVIDRAAIRFMKAMMHKDWTTLWSMLYPDAQQSWQGESDFMHFEQVKFGSLKFISYKDSSIRIQHPWRDPDTTQVYPYAAILSVSLQASAPKGLLSAPSNLALEQGLFNNTLLALVQNHGAWQVLIAGPADLEAPILVPASPPAVRLMVPIFMYHHISNQPTRDLLDYNLTVTTTDFDQQLTWLQQHGYHSISQTELFDVLYYGKVLPAHPMILSFDDGYEDAYTDALPVLLAHHYRGVFYIVTHLIGGSYMTWDQVRALSQDG